MALQFIWNGLVYQPSQMYIMTNILPIMHTKKIELNIEWEMEQQFWHLGHPQFANKPRGIARGKMTSDMSLELPLATALDFQRNYKLTYNQSLVGGLIPIVAVITLPPNNPDVPILQNLTVEVEFYVKSNKGIGGESGSTDEIITTMDCVVGREPRQLYSGVSL
jgi:hypothetical protein